MLELIQSLLRIHAHHRIVIRDELQFGEHLGNVDRCRRAGLTQCVLMQNMAGHGKQIGLGASDTFVMFDSHKAQKYFLGKIRCVGVIAQARGKKSPQPLAVATCYLGNECMSGLFFLQFDSGKRIPRGSRAVGNMKWIRLCKKLFAATEMFLLYQ